MWYFKDLNLGYEAIFSTKEKADTFVKAYGIKMYDLNGVFPVIEEDYTLESYKLDPDFIDFFFYGELK